MPEDKYQATNCEVQETLEVNTSLELEPEFQPYMEERVIEYFVYVDKLNKLKPQANLPIDIKRFYITQATEFLVH